MEVIQKRRAEKPEVRDAAREAALRYTLSRLTLLWLVKWEVLFMVSYSVVKVDSLLSIVMVVFVIFSEIKERIKKTKDEKKAKKAESMAKTQKTQTKGGPKGAGPKGPKLGGGGGKR